MKYMLLIYLDEQAWERLGKQRQAELMASGMAISRELKARGRLIGGSPLQSVTTASTVRYRDGKPVITDGPFAETREQLGGYTLITADNLDEALEIATRYLGSSEICSIEVRPVLELKETPLQSQ